MNVNSGQHDGLSYHLYFSCVIDRKTIVLTLTSSQFIDTIFKYIDLCVYNTGRLFRCVNQLKPYANEHDVFTSELDYHELIIGSIEDTIIQNIKNLPNMNIERESEIIVEKTNYNSAGKVDTVYLKKETRMSRGAQNKKFLVLKAMLITLNQTLNLGIERIPDTLFITDDQNTRILQVLRLLMSHTNDKERLTEELKVILNEIHDGVYYYGAIGQFLHINFLQLDDYDCILKTQNKIICISKYPIHGAQGKIITYLLPSLNNLERTCKLAVHKYATNLQSKTKEERESILNLDVQYGHKLLLFALSDLEPTYRNKKIYLDDIPIEMKLLSPELIKYYEKYNDLKNKLNRMKTKLIGIYVTHKHKIYM
jgi:hypothetical protein